MSLTPPSLSRSTSLSEPANHEEYVYEFRAGFFYSVDWEENPVQIHDKVREYLQRYLKQINKPDNQKFQSDILDYQKARFAALIFFSNRVEDSGLKESDTYNLIMKIFEDGTLSDVHDEKKVNDAAENSEGKSFSKNSSDIRSRKEVIQHAQAYYFLCVQHLHDEEGLTEKLVLETHKILMRDMSHEDNSNRLVLAGAYRKTPCNAGFHQFIPADSIRRCWLDILHNYNYYKDKDNEEGFARDPYSLAAYMMYEFVTIHPFEDGNGRMCRLILNYVLLRYGIPFPIPMGFGTHKNAKQHYLRAIQQARKKQGHTGVLSTIIIAAVEAGWATFFENQRLLAGTKKGNKQYSSS